MPYWLADGCRPSWTGSGRPEECRVGIQGTGNKHVCACKTLIVQVYGHSQPHPPLTCTSASPPPGGLHRNLYRQVTQNSIQNSYLRAWLDNFSHWVQVSDPSSSLIATTPNLVKGITCGIWTLDTSPDRFVFLTAYVTFEPPVPPGGSKVT